MIGTDGNGVNDAAEGNTIAYNGADGVSVVGAASTGNTIRGNAIYSNSDLAIDLANDGVTLNDNGNLLSVPRILPDSDIGLNLRQNYPEISSARRTASGRNAGVSVTGVLNSTPSTTFVIDVYRNGTAAREGHVWVGSVEVTTNRDGTARFSATFGVTAANVGDYLTTTATQVVARTADGRITGNTSEFSVPYQVTGSGRNSGSLAFAGVTTTRESTGSSAMEFAAVHQDTSFDQSDELFSLPTDWIWFEEMRTTSVRRPRRR